MKIGSTRSLDALKPVLNYPDSTGPDPVYWVFDEISAAEWANLTLIAPGSIGEEYSKTFGHYHPVDAPVETYHLIDGSGVLIMQKKHFESGQWITNQVDVVYLIKAEPGDEIRITPQWGHSWSNIGDTPLLTYDDWRHGHTPADYAEVTECHGMSYYLLNRDGQPTPVANPNYQNIPEPIWITPENFKNRI